MSTKAVIVWLLLAVVLGTIAVAVLLAPQCSGPSTTSAAQVAVGSPIVEFVPGEVRQITVETPADNLRQIVERAPAGKSVLGADADWQLRMEPLKPGPAERPMAAPWPLEPARIQALLRALAETRAVAPAPADAAAGDNPPRVRLQIGASQFTLTLAERTLAGTGLVVIEGPSGGPRRAIVRDDIHRVFTQPGPRAWRESFPFGGIAPDASRIRLESSIGKLLLGKIDGKWNLIEPAPAPASQGAVQQLVGQLARVQIADFLDSGSAGAATGLEKTIATLRVEADRRTVEAGKAEPVVSTDALEITIGGSAAGATTASAPRVYASINGERLLLLDGRSIGLTSDPAAYVWPSPIREVASNIGGFAFEPAPGSHGEFARRTFRRAGTSWAQILPGDHVAPVSDSERRGVEEVLAFLTGDRGASGESGAHAPGAVPGIAFAEPEKARPVGTLRVDGLTDAPLDTLEVVAVNEDKVSVRTGRVWRTYDLNALPPLLASAARATSPSPKSDGAPTRPAP